MKAIKKINLFLVIVFLISSFSGDIVFAETEIPSLNINAKAAILIEPTTGKIILEQNSHEKLPPASVTKVMTILLIYDAIANGKIKWEDVVTVSSHAASMGGSQIFLEPMEQQPVKELLKSIVIASANDSAVAMSEFIAGSEEGFVIMMNQKAKELQMNDTNFVNACGLDVAGHVTSAYDIAIMTKELINKYPEVFVYSKTWQDSIIHKTARGEQEFGLTNTNKLIKSYQGATGLKTGSTSDALYCLSGTAEREGMSLITVVLGAPDPNTRFHEVMKMFDYGFANYSITKGEEIGTVKGQVNILKGKVDTVEVVIKSPVNAIVKKGNTFKLESKVEILKSINAPVLKGTKAGEIIYIHDGIEVGKSDLVTNAEVEAATLPDVMKKLLYKWFK